MYSKISSRDPTQTPGHAGVRSRGERWANQHYRMINCHVESPEGNATGADGGSVDAIIIVNALGSVVDVVADAGYRLGFSREKLSLSFSLATLHATTSEMRSSADAETRCENKKESARWKVFGGLFSVDLLVQALESFGNLVLCSIQQ